MSRAIMHQRPVGNYALTVEREILDQIKVGTKILFSGEKQSFRVICRNERYIICTKPFNLKKTVIYTIIDIERGARGTENLIFCFGFETPDLCNEALERLATGESEVSWRNCVELQIEKIINKTP